MAEDELAVLGGQTIIHHHIHPLAEPPEVEVEDTGVLVLLRALVPFLLLDVRDDLTTDKRKPLYHNYKDVNMSVGWDVKWCPVSRITTPLGTQK